MSFLIEKGGSFPFVFCKHVPEGSPKFIQKTYKQLWISMKMDGSSRLILGFPWQPSNPSGIAHWKHWNSQPRFGSHESRATPIGWWNNGKMMWNWMVLPAKIDILPAKIGKYHQHGWFLLVALFQIFQETSINYIKPTNQLLSGMILQTPEAWQ